MIGVYVSGSVRDIKRVREVQGDLVARGCHITHDWTRYAGPKDNWDEAQRQLNAVYAAEVFVLVVHPKLKAGWMEFGAAVSHRIPSIVMPHVGVSDSMWYSLPWVHIATPGGRIADDVYKLVSW